jgi:NADPH-dependent curcumin reductase CurA
MEGLEAAPRALRALFTGGNTGKLLVQIAPEP